MVARVLLFSASVCLLFTSAQDSVAQSQHRGHGGFRATSKNFVVNAPDAQLAQKVADEAERFRKELSELWLGYEIKSWSERCPIDVQLGMHAGGETSFAFVGDGQGRATPTGWQMKIFGPPDRLLDAVLPHEITHTIFATHFGRPLPRWADEGACTTVEHQSERDKNHHMLINFLSASPSRGIPFNRMFTMRRYPHDILPLYAQGHSVAKFLIMQKGRRHFLDYLEDGMRLESAQNDSRAWDVATSQHYGFSDLSKLQLAWIDWVKGGSIEQAGGSIGLASATEPVDAPTRVAAAAFTNPASPVNAATSDATTADGWDSKNKQAAFTNDRDPYREPVPPRVASATGSGGWYARQMKDSAGNRVSTNRRSLEQTDRSAPSDDSRVDSGTVWR